MVLPADVGQINSGFWELHFQRFQMLDDDAGYGKIPEPLVIGGDDEPRRLLCAAPRNRLVIGFDIFAPEAALLVVRLADLPMLRRVLEPLLEALQLLLLGDVQIKLE